jgi:transposase
MLSVLVELVEQIATLEAQIAEQLALHADAHIFQSLPRGGTVRAARLLAEIGDVRGRFPDAASLACLAGVAPSTRQSGKHKAVTYRWAVNKELRDAVCDFAGDSRRANPWVAKIYNDAIARGKDHPPRHPHPGPGLARRDLALLAERDRLRPRPTRRPQSTPQRR